MQTMNLHMRNGEVVFHCNGCSREFYVDSTKAFVPQLQSISAGHNCYPLGEQSTVLATLTDDQPLTLDLVERCPVEG